LGVDVDGVRLKIESLPNDPDLLTQLTAHKVSLYVGSLSSNSLHPFTHLTTLLIGRCDSPSDTRSEWSW
jgi:hypothetical protein